MSEDYKIKLIASVMKRFRNLNRTGVAGFIIMALEQPVQLKKIYPEIFKGIY